MSLAHVPFYPPCTYNRDRLSERPFSIIREFSRLPREVFSGVWYFQVFARFCFWDILIACFWEFFCWPSVPDFSRFRDSKDLLEELLFPIFKENTWTMQEIRFLDPYFISSIRNKRSFGGNCHSAFWGWLIDISAIASTLLSRIVVRFTTIPTLHPPPT